MAVAAAGITKSALVAVDSSSTTKGNFFFLFLPDVCHFVCNFSQGSIGQEIFENCFTGQGC